MDMIYIFYRTDAWLSNSSREMVYISDSLEDGIAQCKAYRKMTDEQAEQIREMQQSQCNNLDYEWIVETHKINTFVD